VAGAPDPKPGVQAPPQPPARELKIDPTGREILASTNSIAASKILLENPKENLTMDALLSVVRDKTVMTFDPDGVLPKMTKIDGKGNVVYSRPAQPYQGHGTQIEYLSRDGKLYLWYPGNSIVLTGEWRTETRTRDYSPIFSRYLDVVAYICFRYNTPSTNRLTGESGDTWSCRASFLYVRKVVDSASGDTFGLSRRSRPPFILERERTTLEALKRSAGAR